MCRPPASAPRERRRGVATVELAVLLPLLFFVFAVSLDYCRIFYFSVAVSNCARNGAAYGSTDQARARDIVGIQAAAQADGRFNLDPQLLRVTPATDDAVSYVQVTVTYPFTPITHFPGIPLQTNLSRTVRIPVVPAMPTFN